MAPDPIARARQEGRTALTEVEAKLLMAEAGIPVVETRLARSEEEAVALARRMGWPVAVKVASPDILHKTEVGGVRVGVADEASLRSAYREVTESARRARPDARIEGVAVQRMAPPPVAEVILGAGTDPQFGPYLMFGLGGVFVEVLRDVSFRIVPLTPRDAAQMVREVQGHPLLEGHRGRPPADLPALEAALLALSRFLEARPEVKELDLNPVFVYPRGRGLLAVDARILLHPAEPA